MPRLARYKTLKLEGNVDLALWDRPHRTVQKASHVKQVDPGEVHWLTICPKANRDAARDRR